PLPTPHGRGGPLSKDEPVARRRCVTSVAYQRARPAERQAGTSSATVRARWAATTFALPVVEVEGLAVGARRRVGLSNRPQDFAARHDSVGVVEHEVGPPAELDGFGAEAIGLVEVAVARLEPRPHRPPQHL